MTEKKRRTLEQQIADLENRRADELKRLMGKEQCRLAEKALNKKDIATAEKHLEEALRILRATVIPKQQVLPAAGDSDESFLNKLAAGDEA